jgi:hypothetical protein
MQANGHDNHQGQVTTGLVLAIKIGAKRCNVFSALKVKVSYCAEYCLLAAFIFQAMGRIF